MPAGKKFGGRTKGTPNKKTEEQLNRAQRIIDIIEANFLDNDLEELSAKERSSIWANLLEYVQPKLARHEVQADVQVSGGVNIYIPTNGRDEDAASLQK